MAELLAIEVEKKMILPPVDDVNFTEMNELRAEPVAHLLSYVALLPGPRRTAP